MNTQPSPEQAGGQQLYGLSPQALPMEEVEKEIQQRRKEVQDRRELDRRTKEVQDRRELARRTIDDMARLLSAMKENSLTSAKGNMGQPVNLPLTITLDEPRIEAIVGEYMRFRMIAQSVASATHDWELDISASKTNIPHPSMLGAKI